MAPPWISALRMQSTPALGSNFAILSDLPGKAIPRLLNLLQCSIRSVVVPAPCREHSQTNRGGQKKSRKRGACLAASVPCRIAIFVAGQDRRRPPFGIAQRFGRDRRLQPGDDLRRGQRSPIGAALKTGKKILDSRQFRDRGGPSEQEASVLQHGPAPPPLGAAPYFG